MPVIFRDGQIDGVLHGEELNRVMLFRRVTQRRVLLGLAVVDVPDSAQSSDHPLFQLLAGLCTGELTTESPGTHFLKLNCAQVCLKGTCISKAFRQTGASTGVSQDGPQQNPLILADCGSLGRPRGWVELRRRRGTLHHCERGRVLASTCF